MLSDALRVATSHGFWRDVLDCGFHRADAVYPFLILLLLPMSEYKTRRELLTFEYALSCGGCLYKNSFLNLN